MLHRFSLLSLIVLAFFALAGLSTTLTAAEVTGAPPKEEHEAIPLKPAELYHIGKFAITNSMLVTWIVAAGMIMFAQTATRKIEPVPRERKIFGNGWWKVFTIFWKALSVAT